MPISRDIRLKLETRSGSEKRGTEFSFPRDLTDICIVLSFFGGFHFVFPCSWLVLPSFVLLLFAGGGWLLVVAACRWFSLVAVMFGFMLVEDCVTSIYFWRQGARGFMFCFVWKKKRFSRRERERERERERRFLIWAKIYEQKFVRYERTNCLAGFFSWKGEIDFSFFLLFLKNGRIWSNIAEYRILSWKRVCGV